MTATVTIRAPEVVAMIEVAAGRFTDGDTTEVVVMAVRHLLEVPGMDARERSGSLFGANRGSVVVADGVDLTAPVLQDLIGASEGQP